MSPEQITGGAIDGRSDIYSADCILYELLVGAVPFSGPSGEITITRRLTEPPPHPRRLNRSVGRRLDQVVVRAMARERDQRYGTAEEFRHAVAEATRPDFTNAWEQRWAAVNDGFADVRRHAAGALSSGGRGLQAGVLAVGRWLASAAAAACRLQRFVRPLFSWKVAAAGAVLALLGVGTPTVLEWLSSRSAAPAAPAAVPGSEQGGDPAAPPGDVVAGDPGAPALLLARQDSPATPAVEAFDQLRLVRSRLDALRASYPEAEALRQLRTQLAQVQSATTSQCDAARRVAVQLGETPPVCL
jgi:hypothetical protein